MRPLLPWLLGLCLLLAAGRAEGALQGAGGIAKAGLLDDNPEHVGMLLKWCSFEGASSSDGGRTWKIVRISELPGKLRELPVTGPIRYSIGDDDYTFQRSDDAGRTWTDASPWKILWTIEKAHYGAEYAQYMTEHARWLPNDAGWPYVFVASLAAWTILGAFFCRLRGRYVKWIWLQSFLVALLLGFGSLLLNTYFLMVFEEGQWTFRGIYWNYNLAYPLWPLGLFMQLTGNAWLAPVFAFICMTATALYFAVMDGAADPRIHKALRMAKLVALVGMLLLVVVAILPGFGWMPQV